MNLKIPVFSGIRAKRSTSSKLRIMAFYLDNTEEELTFEQVQTKFGIAAPTAKAALRDLYAEGRLESVRVIRLKAR